jgi:hypothetical protein
MRRLAFCLMACLLGTLGPAGVASAAHRGVNGASGHTVHLRWHPGSGELVGIATDSRYAALRIRASDGLSHLTLHDDRTGRSATLSPPDCVADGNLLIGGPWLMTVCSYRSFDLYGLGSRRWRTVTLSDRCPGDCQPVAIGRGWIKFRETSSLCVEHCGATYYLQKITSGRFVRDPAQPGGATLDDLDARSGSARLCPPLRYPTNNDVSAGTVEPGWLSFAGPFALTSGAPPSSYPGAAVVDRLRRCRSPLNLPLTGAAAALISSRAVAWTTETGDNTLHGLWLPSLRRFDSPMPYGTLVGLTDRTVYLEDADANFEFWTAVLPTAPEAPTR